MIQDINRSPETGVRLPDNNIEWDRHPVFKLHFEVHDR